MRKTKKVNTDRRKIASTIVLGLMVLGLGGMSAGLGVSQNEAGKNDGAKTADNTKVAKKKDYGVIFGTAYGPDDRPVYRVHVTIRPVGKKHPNWELYSDHRGEFAQRVPPEAADYLVTGEVEVAPLQNGNPQTSKKKRLKGEAKVHMEGSEWHDFSLHLNE